MDFNLTENQQTIRDTILKVAGEFGDDYWLDKDKEGDTAELERGRGAAMTTRLRRYCRTFTVPRP